MRKIEAITICVGYSDFLIHCIEANKSCFDKWVIVTDTKDEETKKLCDESGLICVQTDVFYQEGAFRKFKGINEGLKHLDRDGWICFIDGDIVLSSLSKRVLQEKTLNEENIYGIDRLNCKSFERWQQYLSTEGVLHDNWLLHGAGLEFAARIVHIYGEQGENGRFTAYKPLGFFQLCHSSKFTIYPEGSDDASHGDLLFAKQWNEPNRQLIPEIIGIHLSTEEYKGMNWRGRKSKPFMHSSDTSG